MKIHFEIWRKKEKGGKRKYTPKTVMKKFLWVWNDALKPNQAQLRDEVKWASKIVSSSYPFCNVLFVSSTITAMR